MKLCLLSWLVQVSGSTMIQRSAGNCRKISVFISIDENISSNCQRNFFFRERSIIAVKKVCSIFPIFQKVPLVVIFSFQGQSASSVFVKQCPENMQQIYWRAPMPKCHFNKLQNSNFLISDLGMGVFGKFTAYFQNIFL